ncbi:calcium-activated chloride channel regulator 1-like [Lytechinus variegatus]|uniref:calcium-activated chloride channel regulator 1-like n=1 Tax=Lytechinus variegatus TaxID=7654 RepID=UPI001BB1738E|nr:calcium-activated chloride channel regulator 1-like [Lytechinus variegatus]
MKDDGAYSGCFTDFRNNGRHDVKVNVLGYIDVEGGSWRERRSADSSDSVPAAAPSFMRTASGGVFKVEGYDPEAPDILPPSRIHDLVYTSFSYDNSTVTLSWTAVGDDLDQGTASRYELRYSTNISDLQNNFGSCHEVTSDQLVYGNLENIKPSGLTETITVTLPERGQGIVYNFAIRAWDEAGNEGDLSNFASLSIRFIPEPIEPTTQDQSSTNPTRLGEPSTNLTTPDGSYSKPTNEQEFHPDKKYIGIWCVVVAGILAAGICIPIVCVWISYRRKYPVKFKTEDGIQVGGVEKLNPTYSNPTFAPII